MLVGRMLHGHYWTLQHWAAQHWSRQWATRRARPAPERPWSCTVQDVKLGTLQLSGRWHAHPRSDELLLVVHGLGGSSDSSYTLGAARAANQLQMHCLRLDLRGADRRGHDFYHAGLISDFDAILSSPEFVGIEHIYVLGYSLGGHVCLRYAAGGVHPKVRAVATICTPLDLSSGARAFDDARFGVYRWHVMGGLKAMYEPYCRRRPTHVPLAWDEARKIRKIREWDERIVAPRHGFPSADAYYASESAAAQLGAIDVPCMLLHAVSDPMVPIDTIRPWTRKLPPKVTWVEYIRGGHIGFGSDFRLSPDGPAGLEPQLLQWLREQRGRGHQSVWSRTGS